MSFVETRASANQLLIFTWIFYHDNFYVDIVYKVVLLNELQGRIYTHNNTSIININWLRIIRWWRKNKTSLSVYRGSINHVLLILISRNYITR